MSELQKILEARRKKIGNLVMESRIGNCGAGTEELGQLSLRLEQVVGGNEAELASECQTCLNCPAESSANYSAESQVNCSDH